MLFATRCKIPIAKTKVNLECTSGLARRRRDGVNVRSKHASLGARKFLVVDIREAGRGIVRRAMHRGDNVCAPWD